MKNYIILIFTIFFSCKIQSNNSSINNNQKGYFEDLSYTRDTKKNISKNNFILSNNNNTKVPTIINELDSVLNIRKYENKKNDYIEGFTIQLYLGDNRILAEETEIKFNKLDSLTKKITIFTQPNYRVKVGKYYNRFNANRDYNKFKKTFPNAIIIPEKIKIQ
jgi:Uma2 family endonuclease